MINKIRLSWGVLLMTMSAPLITQGQGEIITGYVVTMNHEGVKEPLIGASIRWEGTNMGVVTDEDGKFKIEIHSAVFQLKISYVGFDTQIITVENKKSVEVILENSSTLKEVEIGASGQSIRIDRVSAIKSELINEAELLKAACCNLSESFETNPSIDVSYTDAITGTRQIQMLGLSGPYVQISRENIPDIRGLSAVYGLLYIPGAWIESIQLNKGTGSVVNGFESMAGQINVELRKTSGTDKFYFNQYFSEGGRIESNVNTFFKVTKKWSSAVLLHGKQSIRENDRNDDGFLDVPISKHYIAINRWKYESGKGLVGQFGIKGVSIDNRGGQIDYRSSDRGTNRAWGMEDFTRRIEGWAKLGQVFTDMPWKSYGVQLNAVYHNQDSYFGLKTYKGTQTSLYGNFIYHGILGNTLHKFRSGASIQYDRYDEQLDQLDSEWVFERQEIIPGMFFEYEHTLNQKLTVIPGIRTDYHNNYGWFVTPRFHAKYQLSDETSFRLTAGRGQRTASIIAENIGILASSRELIIERDHIDNPYGLDAEISWNVGMSWVQDFDVNDRLGTVSIEYYRTQFQNQIVVDYDRNPQEVIFYNLDGRSFSNSFQIQLDYELLDRLTARLAYRWFDVNTTYDGIDRQKPLTSEHRTFLNLAYKTHNDWAFDYTINWIGSKRIPNTAINPESFRLSTESPRFVTMNAQVTKSWSSGFEIYLGGENLLNFRQSNVILSSENPFSEFFDSSLAWGPILGRNLYLGVRYRIK